MATARPTLLRDPAAAARNTAWRRAVLIGLISFLTLVDLFAAQALLPALVEHYGVSPGAMGVAVNASTFGMAVAGVAVALFGRNLDRRAGIVASLACLAVPTTLLATAPDLVTFTALRVVQGVFMATAFSLSIAHLTERSSGRASAGALAAYVTGNVASNLVGRIAAASLAGGFGLEVTFYVFAVLNVVGALLAWRGLMRTPPMAATMTPTRDLVLLVSPRLLRAYAVGFLILFAFIGTFTYVNFILVEPPLGLPAMALGLVYLVFLPAMVTTPLAGRVVAAKGARAALTMGLVAALAGIPLLLVAQLQAVLLGLALIGAGTFFAQAVATGSVGRLAGTARGAAGGLYLASYYLGGLVGAAVIGQLFAQQGWPVAVAGVAAALALAAILGRSLPAAAEAG